MESEIGEHEPVSAAVVRAVSAVEGRKPASLQPLSAVIDPDALDAHFDPQSDGGLQTDGCVSFSYSGCHITIEDSELLTIKPPETADRLPAQSGGTGRSERDRSHQDSEETTTERTPGSRVCTVCQQPVTRDDPQRDRGRPVHLKCHSEIRCGISLGR